MKEKKYFHNRRQAACQTECCTKMFTIGRGNADHIGWIESHVTKYVCMAFLLILELLRDRLFEYSIPETPFPVLLAFYGSEFHYNRITTESC